MELDYFILSVVVPYGIIWVLLVAQTVKNLPTI